MTDERPMQALAVALPGGPIYEFAGVTPHETASA